jgi:hypothetical protein
LALSRKSNWDGAARAAYQTRPPASSSKVDRRNTSGEKLYLLILGGFQIMGLSKVEVNLITNPQWIGAQEENKVCE